MDGVETEAGMSKHTLITCDQCFQSIASGKAMRFTIEWEASWIQPSRYDLCSFNCLKMWLDRFNGEMPPKDQITSFHAVLATEAQKAE